MKAAGGRASVGIRYGGAVLASVAAVTLRVALHTLWGAKAIYSTLYPAVAATALLAGLGPGLLASALCTGALAWLGLSRNIAMAPPHEETIVPLLFFFTMGALLSVLSEAVHRSRKRANEAAAAERDARLARDEILAVVAHDLKNPLAVMALQVELMERASAQPARSLSTLRRSIETMSRLIADLLDASALEAGQLRLEPCEVDLTAVAREVVDAQSAVARVRQIRVEFRSPRGELPVLCDPGRIGQALANLLGNALKFTPPGGAVRVLVEGGTERVRIEIADSGPGIEAERLGSIFQRYERGRRATGGETGLGLYIARGLVEAHGGRIGVRSVPQRGTTFWIELRTGLQASGSPRAFPDSSASIGGRVARC